jgi:integrase
MVSVEDGPEAYLFQNERDKRMTRKRIGEIVREAAARQRKNARTGGCHPCHITAHSLRRT